MLKSDGNLILAVCALLLLAACQNLSHLMDSMDVESRHLTAPPLSQSEEIPDIVRPLPVVTPPRIEPPLELYSVVVQDVPVRQLLFAMARDADMNIDVHSAVTGVVSMNAIDQTLPQILDRISRQVDVRWQFEEADYLLVQPDLPELRSYHVDYVNITRSSTSQVSVSSAVTGGVDAGATTTENNNSTTLLTQTSANEFWQTLESNLSALLGDSVTEEGVRRAIIVSPESSLVTIRATSREHDEIYAFIESVQTRALYQVLIEATIVEVNLNKQYQAGVDWELLARDNGQISFTQSLTGLNLQNPPTNILTIDKSAGPDAIRATIRLLDQFGSTKVLSSPRLMTLNNQTAMLRVVDNKIYFTIEVEAGTAGTATSPALPPTFTSQVHTVPVGFTMSVTPQISEDGQVTLNVRPTISRIIRFVTDPNPALADANVVNSIPEIQIREIESILKVDSGEIAVLGGLMQDTIESDRVGLPWFNQLPFVGGLFNYRDDRTVKTELIIFIRPIVIRQAGVNGDLRDYRQFLPTESFGGSGQQSTRLLR